MPVHLFTLKAFHRVGAEVGFRCRCGVAAVALPRTMMQQYPGHTNPAEIARRMRCRSCKQKTVTAYAVLPDSAAQERLPFKAVWSFGQGDKD